MSIRIERPVSLRAASAVIGLALLFAAAPASAQEIAPGARLWQEMECAGCHGDAALGGMGPTLAHTDLPYERVLLQVRTGEGRMPSFSEDELTDEEVGAIHAWLQGLEPPTLADKQTWWGTDLVNLPTPRTPERGQMEVHFSHRFSESIADAGRERLWGLDSFAFPGFWFQYGIDDRFAAYGGRTANLATWEIGGKAELLREGELAEPLSVGLQAGLTFLDTAGIENDTRVTVELPVGFRVSDRLAFAVTPLYASDTDDQNRPGSDGYSLAIGLGGSVRLSRTLSVDGEWITNVGGFERPNAIDQWQAGVTIDVGGHLFQLLLANNVQTTPDFMAGGALSTGIDSDIRFGFNLIRAFGGS